MIGTRNPNALIDAATFSTRRRSSAGSFVRRDFDSPARNFHLRSRDPLIEKEKPSPLEKVSTKSHFDLAVTLDAGGHWRDPNGDTTAETDRTDSTTNGSQSDAIHPPARRKHVFVGREVGKFQARQLNHYGSNCRRVIGQLAKGTAGQ